jgi:hypothetical protein
MADATDLPTTGGEEASASAESITTEPATVPEPEPEPYRPVSLLAVAAFGLAAVYSALVLFGGLFAMLNRSPWLLPWWTFALPLLAAGAALIARFQIRRSEGTQSGLALTSWTFVLSLVVGFVIYGPYYLATYIRVRWQAQAFAENWLKSVAEGKTEEAFFETTRPPRRIVRTPDDPNDTAAMRRMLELVHNTTADPTRRGAFTSFSASEFVRLLQAAGPNAKIEAAGVKDWDYEKGGYSVTLAYRVTTDLASFPIQVKVLSSESGGRQWQVLVEETGIEGGQAPYESYTDKGKQLRAQNQVAEVLANDWIQALNAGYLDRVYSSTLSANKRLQYQSYPVRFALGSVLAADEAGLEHLEARRKMGQTVEDGGLIRIKDGVFWAPDRQLRDRALAETEAVLNGRTPKARRILLAGRFPPQVTVDDKRIHLGYDLQMTVPGEKKDDVPLMIEGRVIVGADMADVSKGPRSLDSWRVEALELVRARNAPQQGPGARP